MLDRKKAAVRQRADRQSGAIFDRLQAKLSVAGRRPGAGVRDGHSKDFRNGGARAMPAISRKAMKERETRRRAAARRGEKSGEAGNLSAAPVGCRLFEQDDDLNKKKKGILAPVWSSLLQNCGEARWNRRRRMASRG
jgi:hypothetical protein